MRVLLLLAVAALLAVPTAALAGTGQHSGATAAAAKKKPKPAKKKRKSKKTRKTTGVRASSQADEREAKGPIVALSPMTVGSLACTVPATVSVTGFAVGDPVEITCDLLNGVWTLRKIHREDAVSPVQGAADDEGEVEVKGALASLSPLTVGSTTCAVPVGMSLEGFAVGQTVELECRLIGGVLTATKLKHEDDGDDNEGEHHSGSSSSGSGGHDDDGQSGDGHHGSGGGDDD